MPTRKVKCYCWRHDSPAMVATSTYYAHNKHRQQPYRAPNNAIQLDISRLPRQERADAPSRQNAQLNAVAGSHQQQEVLEISLDDDEEAYVMNARRARLHGGFQRDANIHEANNNGIEANWYPPAMNRYGGENSLDRDYSQSQIPATPSHSPEFGGAPIDMQSDLSQRHVHQVDRGSLAMAQDSPESWGFSCSPDLVEIGRSLDGSEARRSPTPPNRPMPVPLHGPTPVASAHGDNSEPDDPRAQHHDFDQEIDDLHQWFERFDVEDLLMNDGVPVDPHLGLAINLARWKTHNKVTNSCFSALIKIFERNRFVRLPSYQVGLQDLMQFFLVLFVSGE